MDEKLAHGLAKQFIRQINDNRAPHNLAVQDRVTRIFQHFQKKKKLSRDTLEEIARNTIRDQAGGRSGVHTGYLDGIANKTLGSSYSRLVVSFNFDDSIQHLLCQKREHALTLGCMALKLNRDRVTMATTFPPVVLRSHCLARYLERTNKDACTFFEEFSSAALFSSYWSLMPFAISPIALPVGEGLALGLAYRRPPEPEFDEISILELFHKDANEVKSVVTSRRVQIWFNTFISAREMNEPQFDLHSKLEAIVYENRETTLHQALNLAFGVHCEQLIPDCSTTEIVDGHTRVLLALRDLFHHPQWLEFADFSRPGTFRDFALRLDQRQKADANGFEAALKKWEVKIADILFRSKLQPPRKTAVHKDYRTL